MATGNEITYFWEAPGDERYAIGTCGSDEEARISVEKEIRDRNAEYGSVERGELQSDGVYALISRMGAIATPQLDGTIAWHENKDDYLD